MINFYGEAAGLNWRCKLGFHIWQKFGPRRRYCTRCQVEQTLEFYSNRTQEWV